MTRSDEELLKQSLWGSNSQHRSVTDTMTSHVREDRLRLWQAGYQGRGGFPVYIPLTAWGQTVFLPSTLSCARPQGPSKAHPRPPRPLKNRHWRNLRLPLHPHWRKSSAKWARQGKRIPNRANQISSEKCRRGNGRKESEASKPAPSAKGVWSGLATHRVTEIEHEKRRGVTWSDRYEHLE